MRTRVRKLILDLRTNRIMRGALALIVGSALAKGIGLAVMPLLTRLYSTEDFGSLALFVSVTTIFSSLLTFRYVVALPIPRTNRRARHLLLLNLIIALACGALLAAGLVIAVYVFGVSGSGGFWKRYWVLVALGALGAALYELASMWATREQKYKVISTSQVWQMISGSVTKIVGGVAGIGGGALIVGQVVQQSGGLAGMLPPFITALRRATSEFNLRFLIGLARKYSDFPRYKLPAHFIYSYASQAPILVSATFWGASATGQLGLAFQALAVPIILISQNSSRVYYAELSKLGQSDPSGALALTRYMVKRLALIGGVIGVAIFVAAPFMFTFVFGDKWQEAGELARALAVYIPFQFVASPLIMAYNIYGSQRQVLITHLVRALIVSVVFAVGYCFELEMLSVIYLYSFAISIHYFLVCRNVIREISLAERK